MLQGLPQFMSAPTLCQFAKDGVWEQAWSFPADRAPSLPELDSYLASRGEIAFEAFFGSAFFGARLSGTTPDVKAFTLKCLNAFSAQASFFDTFQREIGCPVLGQKPDFAEVGSVNAWRSTSAFQISDLQAASSGFELLWRLIEDSPVGCDTNHAKAIEFAFKQPIAHWFGIPLSIEGGSYRMSKALLRQAIEQAGQT